jgi:ATP-binding cassette subfamily B protein
LAALVGPSGAGKTTLTTLVPRFADPQSGRVLIDGHDLRALTLESVGRQVGVVFQDTFLFHASLADNLRYARPGATDADLTAAAKAAYLHEFAVPCPVATTRWSASVATGCPAGRNSGWRSPARSSRTRAS